MTNRFFKSVLLLGLMSVTLSPLNAEPVAITIKDKLANREFSLKVELPDDFHIRSQVGPHFDFYEIHKGSKVFLGVYSGNHPDFPPEDNDENEIAHMNICIDDDELYREVYDPPLPPMRIFSEWKDEELVHRELLARYSLGVGYPHYIHAFTMRGLSEKELKIADRILFSLQLKQKELEQKDSEANLPDSDE